METGDSSVSLAYENFAFYEVQVPIDRRLEKLEQAETHNAQEVMTKDSINVPNLIVTTIIAVTHDSANVAVFVEDHFVQVICSDYMAVSSLVGNYFA